MENKYNTNQTKYSVGNLGKTAVAGMTGLALLASTGCATVGTVNGVPVNRPENTAEAPVEDGNRVVNWMKAHPYLTIGATALVVGGIAYGVSQSGGDDAPAVASKDDGNLQPGGTF